MTMEDKILKDKILKELNWDTVSFMDSDDNWFEGIDKVDFNELADRLVKLFVQSNMPTTNVQQKANVSGSVFLVYTPNRHVIAVCSSYEKAEEIFKSEFGDLDPSVGIEEVGMDVKNSILGGTL